GLLLLLRIIIQDGLLETPQLFLRTMRTNRFHELASNPIGCINEAISPHCSEEQRTNRFHELASNPIGCINVSNLKEFRTFIEVVNRLVRPSFPIRMISTHQ